jgi:hypothetical protein
VSLRRAAKIFYGLLGLGSLANGLWMLASPASWFTGIPAGVPDTGPINVHFVHDIGVVFCVVGIGALWCARNLERCLPVHWGITMFYAGHALVHVAEISTGLLPHAHWWIDAPLTFAPAVALVVIGLPPVWRRIVAPG